MNQKVNIPTPNIKPTTRILAMGSNTQINLDYEQLVHCVKYNILFFCEQMFLEKQGNEHTCESAIYTNQNVKSNTTDNLLLSTIQSWIKIQTS